MIKFCFIMIVYNSDYVLGECLRSVLPYGPMLVTEGPCGYWAEHPLKPDNTMDILMAHKDYGQGILGIKRGTWKEKDQMSNALMHKVPADTTHIFVVDSDEVWRQWEIDQIAELIVAYDYDSMAFYADSFFGGFERILGGFERDFPVIRIQRYYPGAIFKTHRPPTINSPQGRPWKNYKHATPGDMLAYDITMPHYSYVFPSQAAMKHIYYTHYQPGITIPDYMEKIFIPWVKAGQLVRYEIEKKWNGVHNFVPEYRGECKTIPFDGEHPEEIKKSLPYLRQRIKDELWTISQEDQNMFIG